MTWPGADDLTLSPAHCHWDVKKNNNNFVVSFIVFCLVRTQKKGWFRKKVLDANFIICCNYATSSDKGSKNDKNLKLLVVYS